MFRYLNYIIYVSSVTSESNFSAHYFISDCTCNMTGSNSSICDHSTGQCPCKFGVGNRECDQCLPNYYGYDNSSIPGKTHFLFFCSCLKDVHSFLFTTWEGLIVENIIILEVIMLI